MSINHDIDRARKTLYVTGFNPKLTTKRLLEELFTQGAPVKDITMFDTHAYVLFHHEESVPYCLALFNEIELHGQKLRINPKNKSRETFCYMKYLSQVRDKLMTEYMKITPPALPPKELPQKESHPIQKARDDQKRPKQNNKKNKRNKSKVNKQSIVNKAKFNKPTVNKHAVYKTKGNKPNNRNKIKRSR